MWCERLLQIYIHVILPVKLLINLACRQRRFLLAVKCEMGKNVQNHAGVYNCLELFLLNWQGYLTDPAVQYLSHYNWNQAIHMDLVEGTLVE